MSPRCAACDALDLRPHLRVRHSAGESLVPTIERYGSAPDDIVRCARCGHMQVARFPSQEALASDYGGAVDSTYAEEEAGQRATARVALERIERHVSRGAICDLGCWMGFLLSEAVARGWEATGVEPSTYASDYARRHLGLRVITASLAGADLRERSFQAVVMGDVIEHLPRPGDALRSVRRLLVPGGVIYLALPDAGSRLARRMGARWWSVLPTHVQYFTRRSLAHLLDGSGFAVEWMGTAPKSFSLRYYLDRLSGYSPPLAAAAVAAASAAGAADRLITPDFRDRMAVVARSS